MTVRGTRDVVNVRTAAVISSSAQEEPFKLSPGEIAFLWWFIQGSIMNPFTRDRLRQAWGLCERHAWGWMVVEAAFRSSYMHGPAVLYEDLMGLASAAFEVEGPARSRRLRRRLWQKGPCLMCEEGYDADSAGFVNEDRVRQGRDLVNLVKFARTTQQYWWKAVCGKCAGTSSKVRCRRHLVEEERSGTIADIDFHQAMVASITQQIVKCARSFQFEFRDSQTTEDMAAIVSAVGWCSGWSVLLSILGHTSPVGLARTRHS